MAAEGDTQEDIAAHVKSYSAFSWMMKWGTIASFIVTIIVILIISN
ncbi:MAG TPA: aa3-type cytochrome c oxidase subunit IV [Methylobacterium sp.]|jgi:hypothetical protein|nr:aa3-type cytochrome c oxidase subunit IV [Methylobacterium sp.]